jgi:hypothetical protein
MTATCTHDTSRDLDAEFDTALNHIKKLRSRGKVAALSILGAALLALLGMTYAMYARASAAPSFRTGTSE